MARHRHSEIMEEASNFHPASEFATKSNAFASGPMRVSPAENPFSEDRLPGRAAFGPTAPLARNAFTARHNALS